MSQADSVKRINTGGPGAGEPDARFLSGLPDEQLLEIVQRQTFRFFWEGAHPDCGLARDRIPVGAPDREDLVGDPDAVGEGDIDAHGRKIRYRQAAILP